MSEGSKPLVSKKDLVFDAVLTVAIFVLFYFLLIRPQQKRAKEHAALIAAVKRGDTIVLSSGLIGKAQRNFPTAAAAVFLFDANGRPHFDGLFYPDR